MVFLEVFHGTPPPYALTEVQGTLWSEVLMQFRKYYIHQFINVLTDPVKFFFETNVHICLCN